MAPPPRRSRPPLRSSRRRGAALFFVAVGLVVLGATFALGVAAGRRWPSGGPGPWSGGGPAGTRAEREAPRRAEVRGLDRDKPKPRPEPAPVLTFYRDLTAPMTAPPPPRVPSKPERVAAKASDEPRTGALAPASTDESRFTIQVGAFKVRAQAETLRARLAEDGQDAYVSEGEVGGVPQYRVRVGTFTTREAAREAAARLTAERRLATYVTTR